VRAEDSIATVLSGTALVMLLLGFFFGYTSPRFVVRLPRFQRIRETWCAFWGHRPRVWFGAPPGWVYTAYPTVTTCVRCDEKLPSFRAAERVETPKP